jgi:hypothetical protein
MVLVRRDAQTSDIAALDGAARTIKFADTTRHEGDLMTVDGNEGAVFAGAAQIEIDYPVDLLAAEGPETTQLKAQGAFVAHGSSKWIEPVAHGCFGAI